MQDAFARQLALATFVVLICAAPCEANWTPNFGTAGPLRMIGGTPCSGHVGVDMFNNVCDPPPVPADLSPTEAARPLLEGALRLLSLARVQQAAQWLDGAVARLPDDADLRHWRARLELFNHQIANATADLTVALKIRPDDPDLHASYAYALRLSKQGAKAKAEADKALELKPDDVDALLIRSGIDTDDGRTQDALQDLGHAIALDPTYPKPYRERATLELQLGQPVQALADLDLAAPPPTNDPLIVEMRAIALAASGQEEKAVAMLSALLDVPSPSAKDLIPELYPRLLMRRATLFYRLGRFGDADKDISASLAAGGVETILRVEIFLRRSGFLDVPVDGLHSPLLDHALRQCFSDPGCGPGIAPRA